MDGKFRQGGGGCGIFGGPVEPGTGEELDFAGCDAGRHAIAVELDFVNPERPGGEKSELLLDVAFVPAAIDQDHGAGFPRLREGDGGRGVADALAPGDDKEGFEAGEGPGACGEGVFDPEGVQDVGGVGVREGELDVFEFGQVGEELAIGLEGVEEDGHRRAPAVGRREAPVKGRGREPFGPPPLGRQPPKAPIWEAAAFFSTAASTGAS